MSMNEEQSMAQARLMHTEKDDHFRHGDLMSAGTVFSAFYVGRVIRLCEKIGGTQ
jgi:hypothetical protein